jgi:hypothetical protein
MSISRHPTKRGFEKRWTRPKFSELCGGEGEPSHERGVVHKPPGPIVFCAANLVAGVEYLKLLVVRVRHNLVRFDVAGRLHLFGRVRRHPSVANTVSEEGSQGLQFDFPGNEADLAAESVILKQIEADVCQFG